MVVWTGFSQRRGWGLRGEGCPKEPSEQPCRQEPGPEPKLGHQAGPGALRSRPGRSTCPSPSSRAHPRWARGPRPALSQVPPRLLQGRPLHPAFLKARRLPPGTLLHGHRRPEPPPAQIPSLPPRKSGQGILAHAPSPTRALPTERGRASPPPSPRPPAPPSSCRRRLRAGASPHPGHTGEQRGQALCASASLQPAGADGPQPGGQLQTPANTRATTPVGSVSWLRLGAGEEAAETCVREEGEPPEGGGGRDRGPRLGARRGQGLAGRQRPQATTEGPASLSRPPSVEWAQPRPLQRPEAPVPHSPLPAQPRLHPHPCRLGHPPRSRERALPVAQTAPLGRAHPPTKGLQQPGRQQVAFFFNEVATIIPQPVFPSSGRLK